MLATHVHHRSHLTQYCINAGLDLLVVMFRQCNLIHQRGADHHTISDPGDRLCGRTIFYTKSDTGQGIGKKLMQRIAVRAKEENCINVQWQTPVFNTNAINFYNHLGAESKDKLRFFLNRSAMLSLI